MRRHPLIADRDPRDETRSGSDEGERVLSFLE